jgi:hypothetical protein
MQTPLCLTGWTKLTALLSMRPHTHHKLSHWPVRFAVSKHHKLFHSTHTGQVVEHKYQPAAVSANCANWAVTTCCCLQLESCC